MLKLIKEWRYASKETKFFFLTALFIGGIIIITALFSFLRLDYMRSYENKKNIETLR